MKYVVATIAARPLPEVDRAQIEELAAPTSVVYGDLYRIRRGDEPGTSLISQLNSEF
jgi:hypothetical protein